MLTTFQQETLNYWKQLPHVMKYFRSEEDPSTKLPNNFVQGFLEASPHVLLHGRRLIKNRVGIELVKAAEIQVDVYIASVIEIMISLALWYISEPPRTPCIALYAK